MKILILSQYFKPEYAIIPGELASKLSEKGHSVKVLTGFPNYPYGRVFQGYKQKFRSRENDQGVEILRVPYIISRSRNSLLRMLSYLSFGYSALTAYRFAKDCDVIYVYATQMTAAIPPAVWRKHGRTIPFVLHIQDLWPESVTESGLIKHQILNRAVNNLLSPWINSIYNKSSKMIAIAPSMKNMLVRRGVPLEKIDTVLNWADESMDQYNKVNPRIAKIFTQQNGILRFVYAGNLGEMQNLGTVLNAVSKMAEDASFHLYFVGTGTKEEDLKKQRDELELSKVTFVGRVEPADMAQIYKESDFQIISLKQLEIFTGTIPSKLQAALHYGVPVISIVNGDVNQIVDQNKMGFSASANDEQSIIEAFNQALSTDESMRHTLSLNAIKFYKAHMSAYSSISKIESILSQAVQTQGGNTNV